MNRLVIFIIASFFVCVPMFADSSFDWTVRAGGSSADLGKCVATDSLGYVYVAGNFVGSITFGSIPLTCSSTVSDIFVAKMAPDGTWIWAKRAGGSNTDIVNSIIIDNQGNCVITGTFQSSTTFGTSPTTNLTCNTGALDIFVAKIGSMGNWLWASDTNGSGTISGFGISKDSLNNLYVCGNFKGTSEFVRPIGNTSLISTSGTYDIFVAKINSSGIWQWATKAGGTGFDTGYAIATDAFGNSYVTGNFQSNFSFGNTTLIASSYDIFIGKLDPHGAWQHASKAGGSGIDYGYAIALDTAGNCFVTGYYKTSAIFGTTNLTADSGNNTQVFIAKADSSCSWQWAKSAGGALASTGRGIAVDEAGNCYAIGSFSGTATFGSFSSTSVGGSDAFLYKYDPTGNSNSLFQLGGSGDDIAEGVALDLSGNCYVTGSYSETLNGPKEIFVSKATIQVSTIITISASIPTNVGGLLVTSSLTINTVPSITMTNPYVSSLPHYTHLGNYSVLGVTGSGVSNVTIRVSSGLWFGAVFYQGAWHSAIPAFINNTLILTFDNVNLGARQEAIFVVSQDVNPLSATSQIIKIDDPTDIESITVTSSKIIITNPSIDENNSIVMRLPNYRNLVNPMVLGFSGSGLANIDFDMGPGLWYGLAYYNGNWFLPTPPYLIGFGGTFSFPGVDFGTYGDVIVVLSDGVDPGSTLPVELSAFTGISNNDESATITWVSESELDIQGYNLLRNETSDLYSAMKVNLELIHDGVMHGSQIRYIFHDSQVLNNTVYYYWLEDLAFNGVAHFTGPISVKVQHTTEPGLPEVILPTKLLGAWPNPFNPQTSFRYSMAQAGNVSIDVYNLKGQLVRSFNKKHIVGGNYEFIWNGTDTSGQPISSGVYLYRMTTDNYRATSKVMLMK